MKLVYADAISLEIAVANANSNTAYKQAVPNIVSGKILKKYKLLETILKMLEIWVKRNWILGTSFATVDLESLLEWFWKKEVLKI